MLISACYITKNAGEFLDYSMGSIKDFVDEIIVVDDNSQDNTLLIAEKYGATIIKGDYNGDKALQRNEYLKVAKGKWILVVDDDEVYSKEGISSLRKWIELNGNNAHSVKYRFITFWKDSDKRIEGHMWSQMLERCFRNDEGLYYKIHHMVSDSTGEYIAVKYPREFVDNVNVFHYSYLKNSQHIENKIRYYMLRDNPNCNEDNIDEWVKKHPYFSGILNQPRYGDKGLYVAGQAENVMEGVYPYGGVHPLSMSLHPAMNKGYWNTSNKYMEHHWRFHNHLDHERHQNRIKYTSEKCIGTTLEVGCANGFSTDTMRKHNPKCVFSGVEPTDWGYAEAVKNYPDVKFYKAIGECLPFKDGYFDTVLLPEVIEHTKYPDEMVKEAFRVARKRVIVTTPTQKHDDPDHKRFYTLDEMFKLLRPYGEVYFCGLTVTGERTTEASKIYFQIADVDK